jgi:Skp family chaperone for outer membrane proteins
MKFYLLSLCLIISLFSAFASEDNLSVLLLKRDNLDKSSEELNRKIAIKLLESLNLRQKNIQKKMSAVKKRSKAIELARLKKKRQHVPRIFKEQAEITAKFFPEELEK